MKGFIKNRIAFKKIALLIVLAFQALLLSVVETWIPNPINIPGIKFGAENIITVVTLIFFRFSDTLLIILVRCILSSLFIDGPTGFMFSICGAVLSAMVMWIVLKTLSEWFSIAVISIIGSVVHNIGQLLVVCFIMGDFSSMEYLPLLLILGVITGYFVGIFSTLLVRSIKKFNIIPNL